jgi:hypothetical protein
LHLPSPHPYYSSDPLPRNRRRRCDKAPAPQTGCLYCNTLPLKCSLASPSSSSDTTWDGESADTTLAEERDNAQLLSDLSLCEELVSLYFRYIHDKFHSIFHLIESVANGTVPKIILYAIASLSARYTYATPLLSFYLLPSLVRTSL